MFFSAFAGLLMCIGGVIPRQYIWIIFVPMMLGMFTMLFTLRPTDVFALRVVTAFFVQSLPQNMIITPAIIAITLFVADFKNEVDVYGGEWTPRGRLGTFRIEVATVFTGSLFFQIGAVSLARGLKHRSGKLGPITPKKDLTQWAQSRYGRFRGGLLSMLPLIVWAIREQLAGNLIVPPRVVLGSIQQFFGAGFIVMGTITGIVGAVQFVRFGDVNTREDRFASLTAMIVFPSIALLMVILQQPAVRSAILALLSRLATSGDAGRAAGVAALIGKKDTKALLVQARRGFQGVSFGKLKPEHFASNAPDAEAMANLPQRCQLGEVDAFLSHSWHDSPTAKWEALEGWAVEFEARYGRPPLLWFDRACLKQDDIEAQLAQLPVFLSGSRKLLVIVGPTYTERIWCIIEIFTFLRMGATTDRLELIPIADDRLAPPADIR